MAHKVKIDGLEFEAADANAQSIVDRALAAAKKDVKGGLSLTEAFAKHPNVFSKLFVNMMRAAEAGGILDTILERLSGFLENEMEIKGKIKKKAGAAPPALELAPNPDILATLSKPGPRRPALVVGFAAETEDLVANAIDKRKRKGCDWIVANDVSAATGTFGGDRNTVHLISASGVGDWPTLAKDDVALRLAGRIALHFGHPTKAEAAE